jgi:transcriptional regulator with XRE-family HTH domain
MSRKSSEDLEIERRVRGWIRKEMVERGLGVNATSRRLGIGAGMLSRLLNEQRGFGPGLLLKVRREFGVPAKLLLEEDPEPRFMSSGVPDIKK